MFFVKYIVYRDRAQEVLEDLGIGGSFQGEGFVSQQDIVAGQQINKGTMITFNCKKQVISCKEIASSFCLLIVKKYTDSRFRIKKMGYNIL